jgi:hypothetical protein
VFHEVYAYGFLPWTSSFGYRLYKETASRLANRMLDRCDTSRKDYANLWPKLSQDKHILKYPHFQFSSNIGEPKQVLPLTLKPQQKKLSYLVPDLHYGKTFTKTPVKLLKGSVNSLERC